MTDIKPIAMPGTHRKFLEFFTNKAEPTALKVLDLGAGHGAFTQKLYVMGYNVQACDLFPEYFEFDKVPCKKVDVTEPFPYSDNTFDIIIAIEVSEHVLDHEVFFKEANRILKSGGRLYLSTPNILSMKSRMRFFYSGFFYSFKPLELNNHDGLQHIASLTLDQYNYLGLKYGFNTIEFDIDKKQSTSKWLLFFFAPLLFIHQKVKKIGKIHNQRKLLLGRLLFLTFRKK